jgi:anti-sigma regulatory factor (Ser/Thr protein kinase)
MCQRFAPEPSSSRAARAFVRDHLEHAGVDVWPAELLVSELVANAIEHVGTDFFVHVSVDPVRVSVSDAGPLNGVRVIVPGDDDQRGRGLLLVSELAARWGVTPHPAGGKTVWFELAPTAPAATSRIDPGAP